MISVIELEWEYFSYEISELLNEDITCCFINLQDYP